LAEQTVPDSIPSDGARIDKRDILNTVLVTPDGVFFLKRTDTTDSRKGEFMRSTKGQKRCGGGSTRCRPHTVLVPYSQETLFIMNR
jgi:hypothetical protein